MTRTYFGTDGIRGQANRFPMTAEVALRVAMATALTLRQDNTNQTYRSRAVIGKDPRLSGYMLEQAMAAGFEAMGMDVIFLGPLPTPAVAALTRSLRADLGVMISASHNGYQDNGIKLFGADGRKLSDERELEIERWLSEDMNEHLSPPDGVGKALRLDDLGGAIGRYVEFVKSTFPRRETLDGLKVVVDCAHGAAYKVAPQVLWELEAEVTAIGVNPNGRNINDGYGATAPENLCRMVVEHNADVGIALDGDADRLIMADENGEVLNGDDILAVLARSMKQGSRLNGDTVVGTVMANLGLERFLEKEGLYLHRTAVGDRYVIEAMRNEGYNLGGEQSGHIILSDFGTTGDGLLAALQVLGVLKSEKGPASEVLRLFKAMPQVLKNVRCENSARVLEKDEVQSAIAGAEKTLANDGRLLVRPSGTEPLIRVMAEGESAEQITGVVDDLCAVIERVGH